MKKRTGFTRGHLVVFVIFALAIAMGALAVWWHDRRGDLAQQFWGTSTAHLIRHAPRVEALKLGANHMPAETIRVGQVEVTVAQIREITRRPGLVHARHAMIEDANFQWLAERPVGEPGWEYGFRFIDHDATVTVMIDTTHGQIVSVDANRRAQLVDEIRNALSEYLADVFDDGP